MRPLAFDPEVLRRYLRRQTIATLPELKRALGTAVDVTVFRKLRVLDYLSSYSHRGRYYTLRTIAQFGPDGLWSHEGVRFSRYGTLLTTAETLVTQAPAGYVAEELARVLHVDMHEPLRALQTQGRLRRSDLAGRYLYTAGDLARHRRQRQARQVAHAVPIAVDLDGLQIAPTDLGAALLLFYGLLDEQQRRLYAGLESLRLGHGGDARLADFLGLDAHTVARGRQQLLEQDVTTGRVRRPGGGRHAVEKKRPRS
jgi:hypothetical protein